MMLQSGTDKPAAMEGVVVYFTGGFVMQWAARTGCNPGGCRSRSSTALVRVLSLLKILGQCLYGWLVVSRMEPWSYCGLMTWKSKSAPALSLGK